MGQLKDILKEIQIKLQAPNSKELESLFFKILASRKGKAERMAHTIYLKYWNKANKEASGWKWVDTKLSHSDRVNFYSELLFVKNKFKI